MPWVHGDDYMKLKNAELKHLLLLRRLPYSGNKEKMASRLRIHDENHPFPFQKLPPELRNEISALVSSGQDAILSRGRERPGEGHPEGTYCFDSLENVMVRSSLFRTCKQTRTEGLALFYGQHCFKLFVEHGGCFLAIINWLDNMGPINAREIRHLHIHFKTKCCENDKIHMDHIHEKLSDQATVVYVPKDAQTLWYIGRAYYLQNRNVGRAPLFKFGGMKPGRSRFYDVKITDYRVRPDFSYYSRHDSWLEYSMVFNPGESWFGLD